MSLEETIVQTSDNNFNYDEYLQQVYTMSKEMPDMRRGNGAFFKKYKCPSDVNNEWVWTTGVREMKSSIRLTPKKENPYLAKQQQTQEAEQFQNQSQQNDAMQNYYQSNYHPQQNPNSLQYPPQEMLGIQQEYTRFQQDFEHQGWYENEYKQNPHQNSPSNLEAVQTNNQASFQNIQDFQRQSHQPSIQLQQSKQLNYYLDQEVNRHDKDGNQYIQSNDTDIGIIPQGFIRQNNRRDGQNEKLHDRGLNIQKSFNPFLTGGDYVEHLNTETEFLRPRDSNYT